MPSITGLATTAALNVAKYEIPKVSDLVKQTHYEVKISNIKSKYFITSSYNKFKDNILDAKVKNKKLVHESDISGFIKNFYLDKKIQKSAAKAELKTEQNEIVKLHIWLKSFYCLKLLFQWWITKFLNMSTNFQNFHNAGWSYRNNCSMTI